MGVDAADDVNADALDSDDNVDADAVGADGGQVGTKLSDWT